jgi:hypothetical protein
VPVGEARARWRTCRRTRATSRGRPTSARSLVPRGSFEEEDLFATELANGVTRRACARGRDVYPAFAPDGKTLAFVHVEPGGKGDSSSSTRRRASSRDSPGRAASARARSTGPRPTRRARQWSPDGDGILLVTGGWTGRGGTEAVLVDLSGERRSLAARPTRPRSCAGARGAATYVRHARLVARAPRRQRRLRRAAPRGDAAAAYPSVARDGTTLYVSDGGLHLCASDGSERALGLAARVHAARPPDACSSAPRAIVDGNRRAGDRAARESADRGRTLRAIAPAGSIDAQGRT